MPGYAAIFWKHNSRCQLDITYDDEPGPEGFERVSRDLAKGGVANRKAFLWLRRQAQQQLPASDDKSKPDRLADSHEAADAASTQSDADNEQTPEAQRLVPIGEVVIGFGSIDPNEEEQAEMAERERASGGREGGGREREPLRTWERLGRSLNPASDSETGDGGAAVFLWFRRGSEDDSQSWSSHSLEVGGRGERGGGV